MPWAFTEHGALMAANVLNSQRAVRMSVVAALQQQNTDEFYAAVIAQVGSDTATALAQVDRSQSASDFVDQNPSLSRSMPKRPARNSSF